jgi:hypothetical protein
LRENEIITNGFLRASVLPSPNILSDREDVGAAITISYPRSSAQIRGKFLFFSSVCINAFYQCPSVVRFLVAAFVALNLFDGIAPQPYDEKQADPYANCVS